jgi:HSP20 family molecular chaperone IbpA
VSHNTTDDPPFSKFARRAGSALGEGQGSFGQSFCGFAGPEPTWSPAVNLYEGPRAYRVCVELAGMRREDIDVQVRPPQTPGDHPRLIVRGDRTIPRPPADAMPISQPVNARPPRVRVHRMEIDHGPFAREVELPQEVDTAGITATYRAGLLWVVLPKVV